MIELRPEYAIQDSDIREQLHTLLPSPAPAADSPENTDTVRTAELVVAYARAGWSLVCEPGDAVAGCLIRLLGPAPAFDLLLSSTTAHAFTAAFPRDVLESEDALTEGRLASAYRRWRDRIHPDAMRSMLRQARISSLQLVTPEHESWPAALDMLGDHAPLALWISGDASVLRLPTLAVVGARACTGYGAHITADLVEHAIDLGFSIVSGGAYGIDAVAHRTALALDAPTVAVLAGGTDRPYPRAHTQLFQRITERGAVCGEVPPGTAPTRWRFLQRNRNIAALASATLVTEAGARSGSLNTAGHAASLGRGLGAVPGPITSPASSGCHRLVREYGAALISSTQDLQELLGAASPLPLPAADVDRAPDDRQSSLHQRLLDALPLRGVRSLTEVARLAGVEASVARRGLAELDLLGAVASNTTLRGDDDAWRLIRPE